MRIAVDIGGTFTDLVAVDDERASVSQQVADDAGRSGARHSGLFDAARTSTLPARIFLCMARP